MQVLPTAAAYLRDAESEAVVLRSFGEIGLSDARVVRGGIETAIEDLPSRRLPHLLLVDIDGGNDPLLSINRLIEICAPDTEIIALGERNDIVLYRDLKAAGVAEYFYKPLIGNVLDRRLVELSGGATAAQANRAGRLIFVLGVRGGVGATTIATALAWYFAELRQRRVLLLDLDLYNGDAAEQLGAQAGPALREAIDNPARVDELFLARGVLPITSCLALLATLLPLGDPLTPSEAAICQLLQKPAAHYRYLIVDLPGDLARAHPGVLQMPSTVLLVSDCSATGIREVRRWRDFLGPSTADRTVIHVLNKKDADGALPDRRVLEVVPSPEIGIAWDREILRAAPQGAKAVQACSTMQHAMAALSLRLAGTVAAELEERPLWKRLFG